MTIDNEAFPDGEGGMTICAPIAADWHAPGQAIIVLDDPAMVRRGLAGREGVIDHLTGDEVPDMAVVELKPEFPRRIRPGRHCRWHRCVLSGAPGFPTLRRELAWDAEDATLGSPEEPAPSGSERQEHAMPYAFRYTRRALKLLIARRILFRTFLRALRERPIAVVGRGCNYIVDPDFDDRFR